MISQIRAWAYEKGLLKSFPLPAFVVSVGNISMGGTGKSPFVMLLCEYAIKNSLRVGVLSRGYKRKSKQLIVVPPMGILPSVEDIGDEPWMIKNRCPEIGLLVHKNRTRMAVRHWSELGKPQLIILDDGFQHWRARRDRDIVMVDAAESLDQKSIPFGRLRESAISLQRADLVVITRADSVSSENLIALKKRIAKIVKNPQKTSWQASQKLGAKTNIVCGHYVSDGFFEAKNLKKIEPKKDQSYLLISAVAKPDGVRKVAKDLGLNIVEEIYFADHHRLSSSNEIEIHKKISKLKNVTLLVTEKDWARWSSFLSKYPCVVMKVRFEWLEGDKEIIHQFFQEVKSCSISQ